MNQSVDTASDLLAVHRIHAPSSLRWWHSAPLLVVGAAWIWTQFCAAPWSAWNDVRVAASLMAANGVNPYSSPGTGIVSTWLYGPVPLWMLWPASLGSTAIAALECAAVLNILYLVGAIALCCATWPSRVGRGERVFAFAVTIGLWPALAFEYIVPDNFGIALALASSVLLITSDGKKRSLFRWIAAVLMAGTVGCKPTLLPLAGAQVIWLGLESGWSAAAAQGGRIFAAGLALLGATASQFGFAGPWASMVDIPRHLPWTTDLRQRLDESSGALLLQVIAPALILVSIPEALRVRGHVLRLPFFLWLGSLPLDLAGLMTTGGNTNSLHGFGVWAPPFVLWAVSHLRWRPDFKAAAVTAILAGAIAYSWTREPHRPLAPIVSHIRQGTELCRQLPGKVWFPWNPTLTFYADRKFYHTEDGLYARVQAQQLVPLTQLRAGLPPDLEYVVLPRKNWGVALHLTEQAATNVLAGSTGWVVYTARKSP